MTGHTKSNKKVTEIEIKQRDFVTFQLQPYHASPLKKAHGREKSKVTKGPSLVTEEKVLINHRHTNSTDEGIAEIDGPISSPVLLELLKEKDATIQKLEDQLSRVGL